MIFSPADAQGLHMPHADPLVIHMQIGTKRVRRVLVDTGSSVDILYWEAFEQLGIFPSTLKPYLGKLVGFSGHEVDVAGTIELLLTLGEGPTRRAEFVEFTVVRLPSVYNAIMGRASLSRFQAVVSIYHFKLKFPTEGGIGEADGRQGEGRACYVSSLKSTAGSRVCCIEGKGNSKMKTSSR